MSFKLILVGHRLLSVNNTTKNMAPIEAMDQIGLVFQRLIEALASAPVEVGGIRMIKTDSGEWYVPRAKSGTFHTYCQTTPENQPK